MFQNLDSETTVHTCFFEKIGKQLALCEKLSAANFETINGEDINVAKTDLNKDQQYLIDIYKTVKTGECTPDLIVKNPGSLNYSRWLTCVNRVLRIYISEMNFPYELKILASYIVNTYAPEWFDINKNHSVKYGSTHIFKVIQMTQQLRDNLRQIITANSY